MTEDSKTPFDVPHEGRDEEGRAGLEEFRSLFPEDAVYSPDDPIARPEGEIPEDALFSPDQPLKRDPGEEGVVTRLSGNSDGITDEPGSRAWRVRLTADLLERLARDLRERGLEALTVPPGSGRMDTMIRSFVAGYLIGREEDESGEG